MRCPSYPEVLQHLWGNFTGSPHLKASEKPSVRKPVLPARAKTIFPTRVFPWMGVREATHILANVHRFLLRRAAVFGGVEDKEREVWAQDRYRSARRSASESLRGALNHTVFVLLAPATVASMKAHG